VSPTRHPSRHPGDGQLALDLEALGAPAAPPVGHQRSGPEAEAPRAARISAARIAYILGRPEPTPEQVAVIEAPPSPLLVVAGAGSGKTETMAARVVWLVANGVVTPDQVLGLTFTRKAAGELGERVRARLRGLARRGVLADPQPVEVATYNSYAAALLTDHGLRLGLEPRSRLLGEAAAWQLADDLVRGWDGDLASVEVAPGTVTAAVLDLAGECAEHLLDTDDVATELERIVEAARELPEDLGKPGPGRPRAEVLKFLRRLDARRELMPIVAAYARRKRELGAIDFGDQVALAARVAREVPEVGAGERAKHRVVLLDEYQDTSHAQLVLLRSLYGAGHPVTAVGDPHQSIYGWRGASAGNLQRFGDHFRPADGVPTPVAYLSTSWRNDRAVLAVANRLADPLRTPPAWAAAGTSVEVPPLVPRPDAGAGTVRAEWHATVEDEARSVAEVARRVWDQDTERLAAADPKQDPDARRRSIAVLCRKRSQFPLLESALRAKGVPVEVVGLGGLLHVPEVADLRAALEVVHDPTRGDALMRLLTGAAWRVGARDLDGLGAWSRELFRRARAGAPRRDPSVPPPSADPVDERSLVEALDDLPAEEWRGPAGEELSASARTRLERLAALLRGLRSRAVLPLPDLVLEVESALLLDVEVAARPGADPATARAHLDAFCDVAAGYADATEQPTLGGFLSWLGAAEVTERGLEPGAVQTRDDAVQILTVHAAKGLEWDVVAVPGLVEGGFPTLGSKRRGGERGAGADADERPPDKSTGWLGDHGAVPYGLRGDAGDLPEWRVGAAGTQKRLLAELEAFKRACGERETAEERRLAYVAVTRARSALLLTGAVWSDAKTPRLPSRFLAEAAELADSVSDVVGVARGDWAEPVADGAVNPREARRSAGWPLDPLGERRPAVEAGADLVRAALSALAPSGGGADLAEVRDEAWATEVDLLLAERDAARAGDVVAVLPPHVSASRVVALAADPAALALRLRRPMPEPPSPWARRGSAFHAWLERRFGAAALVDVDDLPGAADEAAADEDLGALQERFLVSEWASRTPEAVEVSVETPVAGVVLRGRIDAVFRRPDGGWDVVDWKTGAPPPDHSASLRAVQLAVYRLAWARLHGIPLDQVSAAFFYAGTGTTVRPVDLLDESGLERLLTLE
jgi:DNA helicase-2/ATP-dependent DNA helicase PcrA